MIDWTMWVEWIIKGFVLCLILLAGWSSNNMYAMLGGVRI